MSQCAQKDCTKDAYCKGFCSKHYTRFLKYGSPDFTKTGHATSFLEAAIRSQTDDCIIWPHGLFGNGYGAYKKTTAHRAVCEAVHGSPRDGKTCAAHSCGARLCVNPRHLRWATPQENSQDMISHGTSNKGERHPGAVFSEAQVAQIKSALSAGQSAYSLAREWGVSNTTIRNIRYGLTWGWVKHQM